MLRIHHPYAYAGRGGHDLQVGRNERHGRTDDLHGPYLVSGGWWSHERQRRYFFVETDRDAILWVVADGPIDREDDHVPRIIGWVE